MGLGIQVKSQILHSNSFEKKYPMQISGANLSHSLNYKWRSFHFNKQTS